MSSHVIGALQTIATLALAAAALLGTARLFGALARRLRQPAVVGEILAGVLLGPTVLGAVAPDWAGFLFPAQGPAAGALKLLIQLALALFMLTSGMEVDLSVIGRRRRIVVALASAGTAIPFALGFGAVWSFPSRFATEGESSPLLLAFFLGTALTISALPVIARILKDLGIYRSDLGMVIVGAAFLNDFAGWTLFAVIAGMLERSDVGGPGLAITLTLGLAFTILMLTIGRSAMDRAIHWIGAGERGSRYALALVVSIGLLGSAFTDWLGIHAVFGAFLVGVASSGCTGLPERSRAALRWFVARLFAPIFFASIGMRADFATNFDFTLSLWILLLACVGKIGGCGLTARLFGMSRADAWAAGFALNARGAMEMVLAATALEVGLIDEPLFVALVVMAFLTSLVSAPLIQRFVAP